MNLATELPPMLKKAWEFMPTKKDREQLLASLLEMIDSVMRVGEPAPDEIPDLDYEAWVEGTEHLAEKTVEELARMIGLPSPQIPRFNTKDNRSTYDTWTAEGQAAVESAEAPTLAMFWHQWAGVVKIVHNLLHWRNLILMDGVGVGKTMQATASMCMMDWVRMQQEEQKLSPALRKWCPLFDEDVSD